MTLLQFAGSVVAILVLAGLARALGLGGGAIPDVATACAHAEDALSGFEAEAATVGSDGRAAIVHGRDGSVAVLKLHGAQVAARRVPAAAIRPTPEGLLVDTGERRFGRVLVRG